MRTPRNQTYGVTDQGKCKRVEIFTTGTTPSWKVPGTAEGSTALTIDIRLPTEVNVSLTEVSVVQTPQGLKTSSKQTMSTIDPPAARALYDALGEFLSRRVLIVYRCYDNQEEESCFLMACADDAKSWLDTKPARPEGYENRDGYYFFEPYVTTF
jgi:hypothetical protein